jgi:DUF1365 family protein
MDKLPAAVFFAAIWYIRFRYDRLGAKSDLLCCLVLWYGTPRSPLGRCCRNCTLQLSCLCFACYAIYRLALLLWQGDKNTKELLENLQTRRKDLDIAGIVPLFDYKGSFSPLKPLLFPCRTSHSRFFPKNHSFSYTYLFVGIPVGWRGSIGNLLSADLKSLPWKKQKPEDTWYSVDSADYLNRGDSVYGLRGKLEAYLESQSEMPEDYAHAYLITAPRFLGYSFNPVSFWYLYNEDKDLKAMILEVNNTFDERRIYFLKGTGSDNVEGDEREATNTNGILEDHNGNGKAGSNAKAAGQFASTWPKDFHVSPFNSRKGAYSLSAIDPFAPHLSGKGQVNSSITLSSSKQHPKLVARAFSTGDSIDPCTLSVWDTRRFIALWWWVGFVTFPRIVREAAKLFFRRKLHVWYRPEVLKESIGRNETSDEKAIAAVFREHLKALVEESDLPASLEFLPGIATMSSEETFTPRSLPSTPDTQQTPLLFKVTTPLFYSEISRHTNISTYLKSVLASPDPKPATFHTSDPDALTQLFDRYLLSSVNSSHSRLPLLANLRWTLVHQLRRLPAQADRLSRLDKTAISIHDTDATKERAYRRALLKLLLSDYIALGQPMVIDAMAWMFRLWLCWVCVQSFERLLVISRDIWQTTMNKLFMMILGCVGLHLWRGVVELL